MADIHILALDATRQGGAGVYTAKFAMELVDRGHNVTLICHEAQDHLKSLMAVYELPRISSSRPFGLWRFASFLQLRDYRKMLKKLHLSTPTVVFGSAQPMAWPYYCLYPNRPMIYLPHSLVAPIELESYGYANGIQRRITISTYHFLEKKCLSRASYTVRFTETACAAFRKHYGDAVCKNLVVIPMPIDIPKNQDPAQPTSSFRLLSVGRLIKSKNLSFLLKVLSRMLDLEWHLNLVGSGGEQEKLERYVKQTGMQDRVTFHGHIDDVEEFYRQADLFVFPSLLENLGLVLLEAMSYSLPTLSFRPDGTNFRTATGEIICHESNGLLADNNSMFEHFLRNAIEGKLDLRTLGLEASKSINERHRWELHMNQMESVIHAAMEKTNNEN